MVCLLCQCVSFASGWLGLWVFFSTNARNSNSLILPCTSKKYFLKMFQPIVGCLLCQCVSFASGWLGLWVFFSTNARNSNGLILPCKSKKYFLKMFQPIVGCLLCQCVSFASGWLGLWVFFSKNAATWEDFSSIRVRIQIFAAELCEVCTQITSRLHVHLTYLEFSLPRLGDWRYYEY